MREHKVRIWDTKENRWRLGYDRSNLGGFALRGECVLFSEVTRVFGSRIGEDYDTLKVMQFTGLKDKNGKEVYEGDIVKVRWEYTANLEWYSETAYEVRIDPLEGVVFCKGRATGKDEDNNQYTIHTRLTYGANTLDYDYINQDTSRLAIPGRDGRKYSTDIEVIGNIYENPELLEG